MKDWGRSGLGLYQLFQCSAAGNDEDHEHPRQG